MINDLLNAELVIADLSLLNPNAFYEIGRAIKLALPSALVMTSTSPSGTAMPILLCHIVWMPSYAREREVYAGESDAAEMEAWLSRAINYISDWSGNTAAGRSGAAGAETLRSTLDHLSRWNSLRHSHTHARLARSSF